MGLDYNALLEAVTDGSAGIRLRGELEPLGGRYDKVFPPTYGVDDRASTKYAVETRRNPDGGETTTAVVLDSVASQANRHELCLLEAYRDGEVAIPVTSVDFESEAGLEAFGRLSDLEAPHRIYDAILRDSLDGDVFFRMGKIGRAITEATTRDASALFLHSPATLIFGGWDSTGPRGGRGSKFERSFTSEIVAFGVSEGSKTSSRLDPLGIEIKAAQPYEAKDGGWTLDESEAVMDPRGKAKALKPSEINHGNVAPSIDTRAGGVTAELILATSVLSLIQLRRLRFRSDANGAPLPGPAEGVETAARVALAALGLCSMVLAVDAGLDLRSRCVLVPTRQPALELVGRDGSVTAFTLTRAEAVDLLAVAAAAASEAGLPWRSEELVLTPTPHLATLVRKSRQLSVANADL
jgi:CRISPR-associated protein Csb1